MCETSRVSENSALLLASTAAQLLCCWFRIIMLDEILTSVRFLPLQGGKNRSAERGPSPGEFTAHRRSHARASGPLSQDVALSMRLRVLLQVEKRLDLIKQVTHSTHKKLTACLQGQQGADTEKRSVKSPSVSACIEEAMLSCFTKLPEALSQNSGVWFQKKLPLTILAQCMIEGAAVLGDDSLLG